MASEKTVETEEAVTEKVETETEEIEETEYPGFSFVPYTIIS